MLAGEYPAGAQDKAPADMLDQDTQHDSVAYADVNRWEHLGSALRELEAEITWAQVFWGSDKSSLLAPVLQCAGSLHFAIWDHLRLMLGGSDVFDADERKAQREILYSGGSPAEDPFAQKVQNALDPIEHMVSPYLKPMRK